MYIMVHSKYGRKISAMRCIYDKDSRYRISNFIKIEVDHKRGNITDKEVLNIARRELIKQIKKEPPFFKFSIH